MGAMKELAMEEAYTLRDEMVKRNPSAVDETMKQEKCDRKDALDFLYDGAWMVVMGGVEDGSVYDVPWVQEYFKTHLSKYHPHGLKQIL